MTLLPTVDNHPIQYVVATGDPHSQEDTVLNYAVYEAESDALREFERRETLINNTGWAGELEVLMFKLVKVYPTQ